MGKPPADGVSHDRQLSGSDQGGARRQSPVVYRGNRDSYDSVERADADAPFHSRRSGARAQGSIFGIEPVAIEIASRAGHDHRAGGVLRHAARSGCLAAAQPREPRNAGRRIRSRSRARSQL